MGKDTGFKDFERKTPAYEPVEERIRHWNEFTIPLAQEEVEIQGARCMNCGVPFCHNGCPLGNVIPDFNDHAYQGKWRRALKALYSTNNFPEFTGRDLPGAVRVGVRPGHQQAAGHHQEHRGRDHRAGLRGGLGRAAAAAPAHREVGGGGRLGPGGPGRRRPAQPRRPHGHRLRAGRPDRRAPPLRDPRLQAVEARPRSPPRADDGGGRLVPHRGPRRRRPTPRRSSWPSSTRSSWPAARRSRGTCRSPAATPHGVEFAMTFLTQSNHRVAGDTIPEGTDILATGKDVVVIGGGDTGSDCVGTSIRQKARSVTQIEILPKPPEGRTLQTPWPVHPGPRMLSTSSSQAEGCERDWAVMSKEFLKDESGRASGHPRGAGRLELGPARGGPGERVRDARAARAPRHGLPAPRARGPRRPRRGQGRAGQLRRERLPDLPRRRLRRRRHAPRPVPGGLGHQRGPRVRPRGRRVPDRPTRRSSAPRRSPAATSRWPGSGRRDQAARSTSRPPSRAGGRQARARRTRSRTPARLSRR